MVETLNFLGPYQVWTGIDQDKEIAQDTEIDLELQVLLLWVQRVSSEEVVDLLKTGLKGDQLVVLILDQHRDWESFDLDMEGAGFHSLVGTILAWCTYHENSTKEVELDH